VLAADGITLPAIRDAVRALGRDRPRRKSAGGEPEPTPRCRAALERATAEALARDEDHLAPEHLLLAVLRDEDSGAVRALRTIGARAPRVIRRLERRR
jgi:ATP-dependent Clp protease ATP-binding subunit ClpA